MKPDKYSEAAERSNNNLNRRQEELLRRSLSSLNDSVPAPPPGLPVSLMRAVRQEAAPGVIRATIALIRAQWPVVLRERLVPAIFVGLALVFWTAGGLLNDFDLLVLAGALPVAAGLFTLLLSGAWVDPVHALVSTTRTPFGAIVFARTTVALTVLVGLSIAGSLVLAVATDRPFPTLVAAWLGPTVIIAALATLLAQLWRPILTVTAALTAWASLILLAALELNGVISPAVSPQLLLRPGSEQLLSQLIVALALTAAAWSSGLRPGLAGTRS